MKQNQKKYEYYDDNENLHLFNSYTKLMNYIKVNDPHYYDFLMIEGVELYDGCKDYGTNLVKAIEEQNAACIT